ncbi:MAG: zinc-dependent peptidase [Wenzhouxiangella sp.]|nr:MAG: zinc-dependent peptidase [Wenzhouxiangella sp.]
MLNRLLDYFRPNRGMQAEPPDRALFDCLLRDFPALDRLDGRQRDLLYQRCGEILQTKSFQGADDFEPEPGDCLAVAMLAALPVLHTGLDWYRDFHTFILYPAEFLTDYEEVDEDGLVHSGRDLRAGEAWALGPVVLAMSDVRDSGQGEGFNVVVHELAHQIDQRNGETNGFPPLPKGMDPAEWTRIFSAGYQRLHDELNQGREPGLDPYAAESPAEFFAVACEFFFDVPEWLAEHHPELHGQLARFFRFEPIA